LNCWAFPKSNGKMAKLFNYLTFTCTAFFAAPFVRRPDAVLIVSPPFWLALVGLFLKYFRRCPVIYNAQDLFPEAYLASGEFRPGWFTDILSKLMMLIYRRSDRITVVTNSFVKTIAAQGIDAAKIVSIPNYVDTSMVTPRPRRNSFSRTHGLDDKFVVMYAGNIGYTHDVELLVEASEKLAPLKEVRILVVGGGSKKSDLVRMAERRGTDNLLFLERQPDELLSKLLATADVFVYASKPGAGEASFPGRIYNYLRAGRPIVASVDSEFDLAHFLRETGAGVVTDPGNAESLCQAIQTLYHDASARERMGRNGRAYMEREYSPRNIVESYDALLKQLVDSRC
jgi:colanic acid biosynthesis glycosyl transferase WcaI